MKFKPFAFAHSDRHNLVLGNLMDPRDDERSTANLISKANELAWDQVAPKYMESIEADVDFFRSGGVGLSVLEKRILGDLEGCTRVIHLQCSHGNDVFSLLNLGAHEAIGIDISNAALASGSDRRRCGCGAPRPWGPRPRGRPTRWRCGGRRAPRGPRCLPSRARGPGTRRRRAETEIRAALSKES